MRLKSYFAATVEAAMNAARVELGPDAMLVSTKRTTGESARLGEYEVVFATTCSVDTTASDRSAHLVPRKAPPLDKLSQEVASLKNEMERLASTLTRSSAAVGTIASNRNLAEPFSKLIAAELEPALAQDIIARIAPQCQHGASGMSAAAACRLIASEFDRVVDVDSRIPFSPERNAIALVGPPGAGKTATLVKLAVMYGLGTQRPSEILSLDTHRIAATEPLRSYAAITGLAFRALETPRALAQALEELRSKDLIFIDTPGFSRSDMQDAADVAEMVSAHPRIEAHLVLSASMKPADMNRMAQQYEIFGPTKLIFTHLDETETFGPLLNLSIGRGLPISFLSRGPQIPEDLEPASRRVLIDLVLKEMQSGTEEFISTAVA